MNDKQHPRGLVESRSVSKYKYLRTSAEHEYINDSRVSVYKVGNFIIVSYSRASLLRVEFSARCNVYHTRLSENRDDTR